jgi:hypothetical protein
MWAAGHTLEIPEFQPIGNKDIQSHSQFGFAEASEGSLLHQKADN